MKLVYGKQVYDQLPVHDQMKLTPVRCRCVRPDATDPEDEANPECDSCDGHGVLYEDRTIHPDDMRAILDNLRSQGMPIPKGEGTQ